MHAGFTKVPNTTPETPKIFTLNYTENLSLFPSLLALFSHHSRLLCSMIAKLSSFSRALSVFAYNYVLLFGGLFGTVFWFFVCIYAVSPCSHFNVNLLLFCYSLSFFFYSCLLWWGRRKRSKLSTLNNTTGSFRQCNIHIHPYSHRQCTKVAVFNHKLFATLHNLRLPNSTRFS